MGRGSALRERVEHGSSESTSVVSATGVMVEPEPPIMPDKGTTGSGIVRGFAPDVFTWLDPETPPRDASLLRVASQTVTVSGLAAGKLPDGGMVQVGVTQRAIAIRPAPQGVVGWRCASEARHHKKMRAKIIYSRQLVRLLSERGFAPGTVLPAEYDEKSGMIVAVRPETPEEKQQKRLVPRGHGLGLWPAREL